MSVRGSRWDRFRTLVFATHGSTCHICGHGGARTVDHLESVTEHPELTWNVANCRPAHGTHNRCPVCLQFCNQLKGGYSVERARRLIEQRTGKPLTPPKRETPGDQGREW